MVVSDEVETEAAERKRKRAVQFESMRRRLLDMLDEIKLVKPEVSARSFSNDAGRSHGWLDTVTGKKPKSTDPGAISLANLCEAHGYNVRWLLTGLGASRVNPRADEDAAVERGEPLVRENETADDAAARRLLKR